MRLRLCILIVASLLLTSQRPHGFENRDHSADAPRNFGYMHETDSGTPPGWSYTNSFDETGCANEDGDPEVTPDYTATLDCDEDTDGVVSAPHALDYGDAAMTGVGKLILDDAFEASEQMFMEWRLNFYPEPPGGASTQTTRFSMRNNGSDVYPKAGWSQIVYGGPFRIPYFWIHCASGVSDTTTPGVIPGGSPYTLQLDADPDAAAQTLRVYLDGTGLVDTLTCNTTVDPGDYDGVAFGAFGDTETGEIQLDDFLAQETYMGAP